MIFSWIAILHSIQVLKFFNYNLNLYFFYYCFMFLEFIGDFKTNIHEGLLDDDDDNSAQDNGKQALKLLAFYCPNNIDCFPSFIFETKGK